jgi:hypothetical protein
MMMNNKSKMYLALLLLWIGAPLCWLIARASPEVQAQLLTLLVVGAYIGVLTLLLSKVTWEAMKETL